MLLTKSGHWMWLELLPSLLSI